jgi:hypothetical protein
VTARHTARGRQPALAELQSWVFERVTAPEPETDLPVRPRISELIVAGRLAPAARLEVYRHGYYARLIECLEDDYPALESALGAEAFRALCHDFIEQHPPASPSLNYYGAPFAAYCMRRTESWSAFAGDLARLEWALVEAIHAEEGSRLDTATLGRLTPEEWSRARLVPSPALRLLRAQYPIGDYYRAFADRDEDSSEAGSVPIPLPQPEPCALAVCRRGEAVWRIQLSPVLAGLLESLNAGTPLLAALEQLSASPSMAAKAGATPEELQRAFQDWVGCGLFSGVEV